MTIEELTTFDKLNRAFYETARASSWKENTQRYKANLLAKNVELQEDVRNGTYRISPTTKFDIYERGKPRHIEAPAIRDRVLHKVLCQNILVPNLEKLLIYDNYASLKNRGTAFARKRIEVHLQRFIRKHGTDGYILQIDIKRFFDSIDHEVLKKMLHQKIHEPPETMALIDYIADSSSGSDKGINLGAEAPQIFAIYYLSPIDSFIKTVKGIKYYGRYMDDIFIIHDNKEELKGLLAEIKEKLSLLKLEVNERKTRIVKLSHGFTFMQIKYTFDGNRIIKRPTHAKVARERRRLRKYRRKLELGIMSESEISNCYRSWKYSTIKDCSHCKRTIQSMDSLYNALFPERDKYKKPKRHDLIRKEII